MIEAMKPNIDILMSLLHAEIIKMQMINMYIEEAVILEYIWDNLEHELAAIDLIKRNYEYK